jgi:hypothetical protein
MKQWILVGANQAGFTPREGGPIKSAGPWQSTKTDSKNATEGLKVSPEVATMLQQTIEDVTLLKDRTQQLLDIVVA